MFQGQIDDQLRFTVWVKQHCRSTKVTSPKGATRIFFCFFNVFGARDPFQSLLQALKLNLPARMCDLDAYLPSYVTFRRFCKVWEVAKPFFCDFDLEFFDFL